MVWNIYLIFVSLLCIGDVERVQSQAPQTNVIGYFIELNQKSQHYENLESMDDNVNLFKEYDFIIIGAGTAGCTLAARLSENPNWKILLLEAGGPENLIMDVPIITHFLQANHDINWGYRSQPSDKYCLGLKNNRCKYPRGKVMGGSSVLNYMLYTRGNRRDYDDWSDMGNVGWSYEEVLPYFKKYEGSTVPDAEPEYVGRHGPVKISRSTRHSQIADAFFKAAQEDGRPVCDYNGKRQTCAAYVQSTTNQGFRWSANRAYLYPIKGKRPNLHIRKNALVTKILIDPNTKIAYGATFEASGQSFKVNARMEVILSAGAINTPQLLMLSGVGPAKHLRQIGIKPVADLAVGFNLQDHIAPALTFLTNETSFKYEQFFSTDEFLKLQTDDSMLSLPGGVETMAFYDLDHPADSDDWPEVEMFLVSGGLDTNPAVAAGYGIKDEVFHELYDNVVATGSNTFMIFPMILKLRSRGRIMLQNKDPKKHPLIYPNYFHDPYDMNMTVKGLQKAIEITQQPAMRKINTRILDVPIPQCHKFGEVTSRPYLECYARHLTLTIFHQSGTAKMGPSSDRTAVVDPRLKVYGINNLRVVDASIMPKLISGHPNGPVFMIAEKAANMIKEDNGYL